MNDHNKIPIVIAILISCQLATAQTARGSDEVVDTSYVPRVPRRALLEREQGSRFGCMARIGR